eukprot:s575_g1.t1
MSSFPRECVQLTVMVSLTGHDDEATMMIGSGSLPSELPAFRFSFGAAASHRHLARLIFQLRFVIITNIESSAEHEGAQKTERRIEWSRLLDRSLEETKVPIVPGKYQYIIPSSLALGGMFGALASISYIETAVILHTLDEEVLCREDYHHIALMRGACYLVKDSHVDGFMEWVATSPAWFKALFGIFATSGATVALQQLRRRYFLVREMRLEPLGPCLSPHKVICVSGFLRSLADVCQPWAVEGPWTSGQVCFLRFETEAQTLYRRGVLYKLGNQLRDAMARDTLLALTEILGRFLLPASRVWNFMSALDVKVQATRTDDVLRFMFSAAFGVAMVKSDGADDDYQTGYHAYEGWLLIPPPFSLFLVDGRAEAADVVCDAVLLGTPAAALDDGWSQLRELVTGRFVNGFFAQDGFLLSHQFRRGGTKLAGCSPLHAPDVENIPMDHGRVKSGGQSGQFRANGDQIGWRGDSGDTKVHAATSVRRAEWFEGSLRLLCEGEDGSTEVVAMDGFSDADFDALWRYFEQTCGVYLKKHRPVAALSEADFDLAMRSIEDAADRVDEASAGSVQKKAKEADLMKKVESVRDGLDQAVSGDKQALSRVFADRGCERIGRLRLVVDTVQLEVYHTDPRWKHLLSKCSTIEAVLKELGAFRAWKPSQGSGHSESLLRRAMEPPTSGGYAAAKQVEEPSAPYVTQPLPEPEPASTGLQHAPLIRSEQEESEEEQEPLYEEVAASKVQAAQAAQAKKFEDEEVTDPNSVRASAPDDCYDDETSRRPACDTGVI